MVGCDNPLEFLRDMFTSESGKWRELAQIQAQGAIRAVPGERYLEIIDAVNGTDEVKKKEAQEFLLRLGHLDRDPNTDWNATVTFDFNEKVKLHADGFWAFSDSRAQVEYFVQNAFNPPDIVSTGYRMQTMNELDSEIDVQVETLLSTLQGMPSNSSTFGPPTQNGAPGPTMITWPTSLTPTVFNDPLQSILTPGRNPPLEMAKATRDSAAKTLKSLFKAQYEKKEVPVGSTTLTIPWHPEEGKNLFFILIPDADWIAHQGDKDLSVEVVLHKDSNLSDTFQKTSSFRVNLAQFREREPVKLRFGAGQVRWAVVDPTHTSATIPDLSPDKIKNMENLLHLVNSINQGTGNSSGPVPVMKSSHNLRSLALLTTVVLISLASFFLLRRAKTTPRRKKN